MLRNNVVSVPSTVGYFSPIISDYLVKKVSFESINESSPIEKLLDKYNLNLVVLLMNLKVKRRCTTFLEKKVGI